MSVLRRWLRFVREGIWHADLRRRPAARRAALSVLRVVLHVASRFSRSLSSLQAAGLTLVTLLALVPMLALCFALARALGYGQDLDGRLVGLAADLPGPMQQGIEQVRQLAQQTSFGALGTLGTIVVLWSGLVLFTRTEQALNHIWRTTRRRAWLRRITDFIALVVLVPPFALGALVLSSVLGGVRWIESLREQAEWLAWVYEAGLGFVPHVLLWVAFTALYRILPSAGVRLLPAAAGGLIAGSAIVLLHGVYLRFQVGVARANAIYATLAALPLLLVYLQLIWTVVLIGAEVSYAVQNLHTLRGVEELPPPTPSVRRRLAWHLVQRASAAFRAGERGVATSALAMQLDVPGEWLESVAEDLVRARLLVEPRDDGDLLMPSRPPEQIAPADVLAAAEGSASGFLDRVRLEDPAERVLAEAEIHPGRALASLRF